MTRPVRRAPAKKSPAVDRAGGPFEALVTTADGELLVRRVGRGAPRKAFAARNAVPGYQPAVGDRVLVLEGEEAFLVGVLRAAAIAASDGATARVRDGALELRDPAGALVATWDPHACRLVIAPPTAELHLRASGRLRLEAGGDLELASGGTARLEASVLEATTHRASLDTREAHLRAEGSRVDATTHVVQVGKLEVSAQRLIETAGEVFREVEGLLQLRAGRARTLVKETFRLLAGRTDIASREDTVIDGKRVLLG